MNPRRTRGRSHGAALLCGAAAILSVAHVVTAQTAAPADSSAGESHGAMPGMEQPAAAPSPAPQAVYISPARQQLIGVRTARVEERPLSRTIRTVAVLAYDETRMTMIHPKIAGWVDQLYVDFVGKPVRRGQPLLTIYSPALVATQREYLLALDGRRQLSKSALPDAQASAESLLAATRDRLKLWDISDAQIAALERTGQVQRTLTLTAPFDGVVAEVFCAVGDQVQEGALLVQLTKEASPK